MFAKRELILNRPVTYANLLNIYRRLSTRSSYWYHITLQRHIIKGENLRIDVIF